MKKFLNIAFVLVAALFTIALALTALSCKATGTAADGGNGTASGKYKVVISEDAALFLVSPQTSANAGAKITLYSMAGKPAICLGDMWTIPATEITLTEGSKITNLKDLKSLGINADSVTAWSFAMPDSSVCAGLDPDDSINKAINDASLKSLNLTGITVAFEKDKPVYDFYASPLTSDTEAVNITATTSSSKALIKINSTPASSGTARRLKLENYGELANEVKITVTAQNRAVIKTYTLNTYRSAPAAPAPPEAQADATLKSLTISGIDNFGFLSHVTDYVLRSKKLPNSTTSVDITAVTNQSGAKIKINTDSAASGSPKSISLSKTGNDSDEVTVLVTAPNNSTTKIYTLKIFRAADSDATLKTLAVSGISYTFNPQTTYYDLSDKAVPNSTTSVTVTPAASNSKANILFNNSSITSGASRDMELRNISPAHNLVRIIVTAEDNQSTKTYTLKLYRELPAKEGIWTEANGTRHTSIPGSKTQWYEGEVLEYKRAAKGAGIDIVIVGDAFNKKEMEVDGVFETTAKDYAELFLKMPVVRDFKAYFNIYFLMRPSKKSGIENMFSPDRYYGVGERSGEFAAAVTAMPQIGKGKDWLATYMCIANGWAGGYANGDVYYFASGEFTDQVSDNATYWMAHEFLGHAFAQLGDMYEDVIGKNGGDLTTRDMVTKHWTPPVTPLLDSPPAKEWGWNYFVAPWDSAAWQVFISQPGNAQYKDNESKYKQILTKDGEDIVIWQNRWHNNFMKDGNSLQSDTFDRFIIYRRIKRLANEPYSVPEFLAIDQQYIDVTDWWTFLGLKDWHYTLPAYKHGQPSPYAAWDED